MTTTPENVRKLDRQRDLEKARSLENTIDNFLNKGIRRIPVLNLGSSAYDQGVIREIKKMYSEAGWNVEIKTEPGDGPIFSSYEYLNFNEGGEQ